MYRDLFFVCLILLFTGCGQRELEDELIGKWHAEEVPLTVRTEPRFMKFEFFQGSARFDITIDSAYQLSGTIGGSTIEQGSVSTNWLLPTDMTGVSYTIKMETTGAIFPGDPLPEKEMELWVTALDGDLHCELRYTSGSAQFPMADLQLKKQPIPK